MAVLTLAKLWLVHAEDIYGSATFDAMWNVTAAQHWYWGAEYHWTTFVRPPAYPLWIALSNFAGVPLRLSTELLQIGGFACLAAALWRVGVASWVCVLAYAAAILHPATFEMNGYTLSDTFYGTLLPLAVAGMILMLVSGKKVHAWWTGVVLAVLWNTREEASLLVLALVTAAALMWWRGRSRTNSWHAAMRAVLPTLVTAGGTLAALVLLVYAVNHGVFQAFARSTMSARSFTSAYKALLSIEPPQRHRFVPISREARLLAYEASPSFARLRPHLEGDIGRMWEAETFNQMGIRGEMAAGWIPWALQMATDAIGEHKSAATAERFFNRLTAEIDDAARAGRLPTRRVWAGLLDPGAGAAVPYFPESFRQVTGVFFLSYRPLERREDITWTAENSALYEQMTGRQSTATPTRMQDAATAARAWIGSLYKYVVLGLSVAAGAAMLALITVRRSIDFNDPVVAVIVLLGAVVSSRVALFTVLDATSWPCDLIRYVFPVMPLYSCLLLLLVQMGVDLLRNRTPRACRH